MNQHESSLKDDNDVTCCELHHSIVMNSITRLVWKISPFIF